MIPLGDNTSTGVRTGVVVVTTGGLPNVGTVLDKAGTLLGVSLVNKGGPTNGAGRLAARKGGGPMLVLAPSEPVNGGPSVVGNPRSLNISPVNNCLVLP